MRQELIFRGPVLLAPEAEPVTVELWENGTTVVAFEGSDVAGVMQQAAVSFTDDRRLLLTGTSQEGEPITWEGADPEATKIRWLGAQIMWPTALGGGQWTGAEVIETQYGVRVSIVGQPPKLIAGARTETTGGKRWIVSGLVRILADAPTRKGCGCGGKR